MDIQPDLTPLARRAVAFLALLVSTLSLADAQTADVGLSTVRAQAFAGEDLGIYAPAVGDHFGAAFATGDFNNDGVGDLATGVPNHGNFSGNHPGSGIVVVRYGVVGVGLASGLADNVLSQDVVGTPNLVNNDDHFGAALAACDFNGDGFDDLAVGVPGEDFPGSISAAGGVQIHYGRPAGLLEAGDLFFSEDSPGVPGEATSNDNFGSTLACGDFNGNGADGGFFDLAVGAPHEDLAIFGLPTRVDAGMVVIVPGAATGLALTSSTSWSQNSTDIAGTAQSFDNFGFALAVGRFDLDVFDDLAIGVPGEANSGSNPATWSGAVQVIFGGVSGLEAFGNLLLMDSDVGGLTTSGDQFGSSLSAGNFDGDLRDDLAIGIPFDDVGGFQIVDAGRVAVIYGATSGFDNFQQWTQDNVVGGSTSEVGDRFGTALAACDFDRDGRTDLAAGSPTEFVLVPEDGVVTAWMGTSGGLSPVRTRSFARGYEGTPGPINAASRDFGRTLACGDFDGDGHADLVAGAPLADQVGLADVGDEVILYGSLFADGVESMSSAFWSLEAP
jgi:hypothetical protein